jgi:membrane protein
MTTPPIEKPLWRVLASLRFRDYWSLGLRLFDRFGRHHIMLTSAGVAFYRRLSIFPALTAFVSLFGLVADPDVIASQIRDLQGAVPESVSRILGAQAISLASQATRFHGWSALLGLDHSVCSANRGTKAFIQALNVIYETRETRKFFRLTGQSLLITSLSLVVGIVMLVAIVVVPPLLKALLANRLWDTITFIAKWPFMLVIMAFVFSYLYRYAPAVPDPGRRSVFLGALMGVSGWFLISLGFSLYADNFAHYNETYGALAGVVIFFFWLLLSSVAVLMGAETNLALWHVVADQRAGRAPPRTFADVQAEAIEEERRRLQLPGDTATN